MFGLRKISSFTGFFTSAFIAGVLALSIFMVPAFAETGSDTISKYLKADASDPLGRDLTKVADVAIEGDLRTTIVDIINYFLGFLFIIMVAIVIYAGILTVLSQGDDEAFKKSRTMIIYAIIGMVIIFLSFSIVNVLADLRGAVGDGAA